MASEVLKIKFTSESAIRKADTGKRDDVVVWDEGTTGFGVRFRKGRPVAYLIQYNLGGKERRKTLGKFDKIKLEAAKTQAALDFAAIANGVDPIIVKAKAVSKASDENTVGKLVGPFIAYQRTQGRVESYIEEMERSLGSKNPDGSTDAEGYFKALHRFRPDDVTRADVAAALREIAEDRGPIASNRSRAHLSKFWTWMIGEGVAEHGNPVSGTNKFDENPRDRQPTEKEIATIWKHSDDDVDFDVIQKLIILTGARRGQIGSLRRKEIDRDGMVITLKGFGRSKHGETFLLPLSKQALELIDLVWDRRDDSTGFLFGEAGSKGGFSGWSKTKPVFEEKLKGAVDDYWLHDFRRTFEGLGQRKCGLLLVHLEACMNHKGGEAKAGVRKHYNKEEYKDEKIAAMNEWGDFIGSIVSSIKAKPKLKLVA
jgi:integrase